MNKYKVCVYAISKNEEQFVERWYNSMKEADEIFVLDTGSSDNTVNLLKGYGVNVESKIINPWRFDAARNMSLELVPEYYDICVCTDLDEVFEGGWREKLEKAWHKDSTRCKYTYNWLIEDNVPKVSFIYEKIHSRKNFSWINPVHEILKYDGIEKQVVCEEIILNHYPDNTKSRGSYLPLLELSVQEDPFNDRNMHYLGREYMYYQKYNEAIDTFIKHLNLPKAIWKPERAASMRYIGRCYFNMNRYEEAIMWYKKAIKEVPYMRDGYVELSILYDKLGEYNKVIYYTNKALKIINRDKIYINEIFSWDYTIYDLRSIAYFYIGKYKASYKNILLALELNPNNERLLNNKKIIINNVL